ncbi:PaaI family thioesterase [Sphingosinicella sp. YJ22]|uniref:PaaI family thioesterase n=1 Tax=Sphingosinicella sp. YJ22 TaxID=1104780 RepID=UPI00140A2E91|nr:PaaI family thioesterase [Sphingosinicella sp. YJ22]
MNVHPAIRHEPAPDHPGWFTWDVTGPERFNSSIGRLLVRRGEDGGGWCRMFPTQTHSNLGNKVHGGALMTFIDMALYAGGAMAGANVAMAVTLDCSVQFLDAGELGEPLDAEVELLRETGRLVFIRGRLLQGERLVASFSASLRKAVLPR